MYIFKNALRCISRSFGRNILIGIIVLVIATSSCIGLSIRQAAENAREDTLAGMAITATISFDRQSMMGNIGGKGGMGGRGDGGFDRDGFMSAMLGVSSLTLDDYLIYAGAPSVSDFYYTLTCYVNGSENLSPVSTDSSVSSDDGELSGEITEDTSGADDFQQEGIPGGMMGGMMGNMFGGGDLTIVGYSSDSAMTDFVSGNSSVSEGSVFTESEKTYECIISSELAIFNDLSVGDSIVVSNPQNEEEIYTLSITGIYTSKESNNTIPSMMFSSTSSDPANSIYVSYQTLKAICDSSNEANITVTDEETGRESDSRIEGTLLATYSFASVDAYYQFEEEVRTLGLDDSYAVSSTDITAFENSLLPLNTLSGMAGTFLIVVLVIGAVILVVLNIFNIRERKYEIGVLTAMGMKKGKVAMQFITEIFAVTLVAVIIGALIGAVTSVPVTNALLENQVTAQQNSSDRTEQNFGRQPGNMGGNMGGFGQNGGEMPSMPDGDMPNSTPGGFMDSIFGEESFAANYITEINSATDMSVVLQMLGIALLLTLVSGAVSMMFVMRYDPLKILSNRD